MGQIGHEQTLDSLELWCEVNKTLLVFIACFAFAQSGFADTCEGDKLTIPDRTTLASVQSLAESGDAHAQAQIGAEYLRGKVVQHDPTGAIAWLNKSALGGSAEGQYLLGEYYAENGKVDDNFHKAAVWFQKSASQGCIPATYYLGLLTQHGDGVPKNVVDGNRMVIKAAESGYTLAQLWLGMMLISGDGIDKDIKGGFNWIKHAADAGDSAAEIFLASLYLQGRGTDKNPETGITLLNSVISKHDEQSVPAAYSLGWLYMEGKGVSVDKVRALELMIYAANSHYYDSEKLVKSLADELPKQQLVASCSVYMDHQYETDGAKEYHHATGSEKVIVLRKGSISAEVYFTDKPLVGFIPLKCLHSGS